MIHYITRFPIKWVNYDVGIWYKGTLFKSWWISYPKTLQNENIESDITNINTMWMTQICGTVFTVLVLLKVHLLLGLKHIPKKTDGTEYDSLVNH